MRLFTFFSTGAFVLLTACALQKKAAGKQQPIYNTEWDLKKIYTGTGTDEVFTKAFIRFNQEKGSAGGNGSCNSFGSTVVINGNTVNFSNIFSTKMYCEGVQSTEDSFFKQLEKVNRFEIKDKILVLYHDKDKLLEFEARQAL